MPVSAFIRDERERAAAWKRSTDDLLDDARAPADYHAEGGKVIHGPFGYCLPPAHAVGNLLPDARATALQTFERLGIAWHAGIGDGPGNNLLDSQVQCANALAPHIRQPQALQWLLTGAFPIAEMLPIERDEYVTFEWIGLSDHLDEGQGELRARGRHATSADAAVIYRSKDGDLEMGLIEWKYVEDYSDPHFAASPGKTAQRMRVRRHLWNDARCPLRHDAIDYTELFAEPRYQLFRLQSLAARMEQASELGCKHVRLAVAASSRNRALAPDLARWPGLLHQPDRFAVVDTDRLLSPDALSSAHYRQRYG